MILQNKHLLYQAQIAHILVPERSKDGMQSGRNMVLKAYPQSLRKDKGFSKITEQVKQRIIDIKSENMCRSVNTLLALMFDEGYGKLPRSSVHRLLKQSQLSHRVVSDAPNIERRQFEACKAGDIWYSDVMHGPMIARDGKAQKAYLVCIPSKRCGKVMKFMLAVDGNLTCQSFQPEMA